VLIQARAAGELSSLSDIRDVVQRSTETREYEPQQTSAWDDAFGRFRDLQFKG
jgi:rhamnulokinase